MNSKKGTKIPAPPKVSLKKPIQVSSDNIAKYADIVELTKSISELNPMTKINRYQLMVELGMPATIARLINSTVSIATMKDKTELKKFMVNQNTVSSKNTSSVELEDSDEALAALESVSNSTITDMTVTSKMFLNENYELGLNLQDMCIALKTPNKSRTLLESILKPKTEELPDNE